MDRAAAYFFFAERFGWTPAQVDELPVALYDRLPAVAVIHDEVSRAKQEEQLNTGQG